jgi:hypothetical protein
MGPTTMPALRRVPALVVVTSLLVGCASAPGGPPAAPPDPALPAPALPDPALPAPPAVRLAAAAAVTVARPAGTAGATLTVMAEGSTVADVTWSGWSEGAWSHRASAVVDGVTTTVGEVLVVDGLLHARIGGDPWRTAPAAPGAGPDAVRDPAEVLALLRRAAEVTEGPAADVLVATVPHVALIGAEGEDARFEVRLTGGVTGVETVAEVRGTIPPLGPGGVDVVVDAWWSAEPPPAIVAPSTDEAAPTG